MRDARAALRWLYEAWRARSKSAWWAPWVALAAAAWLSRPASQLLCPGPVEVAERGALMGAVLLREGLVMLAWGGMIAHSTVIRGPHRSVLSLLPVDGGAVVAEELRGATAGVLARALWVHVLCLEFWTRAAPDAWWAVWGVSLAVVALAGRLGLSGGGLALLGAIEVGRSPAWGPILDLGRGATPRAQAALIWALAPVVIVGGGLVGWTANALGDVFGASSGGVALAAGVVGCIAADRAAALAAGRVGGRSWFHATVTLEDIRSRYARIEKPEDALWVPMEHVARRLPAALGREVLLELRQGHRAARTWLSGGWAAAFIAAASVWGDDPAGPARATAALGMTGFVVAGAVLHGAAEQGPFLTLWLRRAPTQVALPRAIVVLLWSAWPVLVGAAAGLVRSGAVAGQLLWSGALGAGLAAALAATAAGRTGARWALGAGAGALVFGLWRAGGGA
jgi:hypothetical protein